MTLKQVKRSKILNSHVIHHFGLFWVEKLVGANDFFGKCILDLNKAKRSKFKKCDVIHQFGLFWVEKLFGANDFDGKWIIDLKTVKMSKTDIVMLNINLNQGFWKNICIHIDITFHLPWIWTLLKANYACTLEIPDPTVGRAYFLVKL